MSYGDVWNLHILVELIRLTDLLVRAANRGLSSALFLAATRETSK